MPTRISHTTDETIETASELPKKFRVQLDFDRTDFNTVNGMVDQLDLPTRAELFRSGLRVIRWMMAKKTQGCIIAAITPDGRYIEPEFDFFQRFDHAGSMETTMLSREQDVALTA